MRLLYLLAIKNIATPYAHDPPTAAKAIPAVVPLTLDEVLVPSGLNTLLFPLEAELEVAALPLPVPVAPDAPKMDPPWRGIAGLM